jgi:hypothetical protein
MEMSTAADVRNGLKWSKRLGVLGFLFFLAKGLLWLAMLAAAWWLG